jgi:hypothetical protein
LGNRRSSKVLLAPVDTKQLHKTHRAALDAVAKVRGSPTARRGPAFGNYTSTWSNV